MVTRPASSPEHRRFSWRTALAAGWPVLALAGQNLVIFQNHYFRNFTFPWDFGNQFYAFTSFWTAVLGQGVIPAWIPFFGMGMPFDLILESGWHYPPLYLFPILRIPYSLHAAVVVECLHVLFGALGMFFFLRLVLPSGRFRGLYALLGAFTFQFFGGFYSNAEHVGIVRAFSFAPWLFFVFTILEEDGPRASWRVLLVPPLILLAATGSYPGNLISGMLVSNLYLLFQLVALQARESNVARTLRLGVYVLSLEILGAGLSAMHLGPAWFFRDWLQRASDFQLLDRFSLGLEHLPALFLNNAVVPGEISMTSTFVTLPALILLTYIPISIFKKRWPMATVTGFSILMAAGDRTFLGILLPRLIPVLRYSRWPSSDYRAFIAIGLIFFAVLSLGALLESGITWKSFLVRTGLVLLWFIPAVYLSYPALRSAAVYSVTAICVFTILWLGFAVVRRGPRTLDGALAVGVLIMLVSLDAFRVLPQMATWQDPSSRRLRLYDVDSYSPATRPARIEKKTFTDADWEGFTTGRYTLSDLVRPNMLENAALVVAEPRYKQYMLAAWTPLFVAGDSQASPQQGNIEVSPDWIQSQLDAGAGKPPGEVRQTRYGLNTIEYEVSLTKPSLMLENEMYFPGWSAVLTSAQGKSEIQALSANGLFRAWSLPAGSYTMLARFDFPYVRVFLGISLVSFLIWLGLLFPRLRALARPSHLDSHSRLAS